MLLLPKTNHSQVRRRRLSLARTKGTHTKQDWQEMKDFFDNTCCYCYGNSGLVNVEKDHIVSLYQGGSDSIQNLQPLCAYCNIAKSWRNIDGRPELATMLGKELPEKYKYPY